MKSFRRDEMFPAPLVPDALPPTEEQLLSLIAERGSSLELQFSLGNFYLRRGQYQEAINAYREALTFGQNLAELNTNLGLSYFALEKFEEALSHFRQAILLQPTLPLPYLHSARTQVRLQQLDPAIQSLEKLLRFENSSGEALQTLAELYSGKGDLERSLAYYRQAYEIDPSNEIVRNQLAYTCFEEGRAAFVEGNLDLAFSIWSAGHKRYYPAFAIDQRLLLEFGGLVKDWIKDGQLKQELQRYQQVLAEKPGDRSHAHSLFSRFLFSIGLFPECYVSVESLSEEALRWRQSLLDQGEHPYPHFRLGLIACYEGRYEEAEGELRHCQDRLLPKKQANLHLGEIIAFLGQLKDFEKAAQDAYVGYSPDWEWEKCGFQTRFEFEPWKKAGIAPAFAKQWREAGFTALQAKAWSKEGMNVEESLPWSSIGLTDPKTARKWKRAGMGPNEAKRWNEHFSSAVEQAIQCRNVGFTDPALAAEWLRVLMFPWDAVRWHEQGWSPQGAEPWIQQGITDPFVAKERMKNEPKISFLNVSNEAESEKSADFIDEKKSSSEND